MRKLVSGILVLVLCNFAANAQTGSVLTVDNLVVSNSATFYGNVQLVGTMPADVSSSGLALSYDFASSNTPITDLSGNSNSGNRSGAVWSASGFTNGGCYTFTGTNQWLETATNRTSLSLTNQLTILAWIKLNQPISSTYPMIATKQPSGAGSTGASGNFEFRVQNPGVLSFNYQYNSTASEALTGTAEVDDGRWHLVGVTADSATKMVRLFIDGKVDKQQIMANKPISQPNTEPVRIGRRKDGYFFTGSLDEPRIYGRALSPDEMATFYAYSLQQKNTAILSADRINQIGVLQTNIFMGSVGIGTNVATNALNVAGVVSATKFVGDGSSIANINGGNLINASIAGAKLANGTITATQIATNAVLTGVNVDMVDGKHAADLATASQGARLDLLNSAIAISNEILMAMETFDTNWACAPCTNFMTGITNPVSGWAANYAMITSAVTNPSAPYVCMFKEFSATNAWVKSPLLTNGYSSVVFSMQAASNNAPIIIALESSSDGANWSTIGSYSNAATNLNWYTFTNFSSGSQMYAAQYLRLRKMTEVTNNIGYRVKLDSIAVTAPVPHAIAKELQVANITGPVNFSGAMVTGLTASAVAGLGSAATQDAASFATAAQGARADTALQPGMSAAVQDLAVTGNASVGSNLVVNGVIFGSGSGISNIPVASLPAQVLTNGGVATFTTISGNGAGITGIPAGSVVGLGSAATNSTAYFLAAAAAKTHHNNGTGLEIGTAAVSTGFGTALGLYAVATNEGTAVGYGATGNNLGAAVGAYAEGKNDGTALGYCAKGNDFGTTVGEWSDGSDDGAAVGFVANGRNYGAAMGEFANGSDYGATFGGWSEATNYGVAVGLYAVGSDLGVSIGYDTKGTDFGVAVGERATAVGVGNIAIGAEAVANTNGGSFTFTTEIGTGDAVSNGWFHYRGNPVIDPLGGLHGNGAGITNIPVSALPPQVVLNGGSPTFASVSGSASGLSNLNGSAILVGTVAGNQLASNSVTGLHIVDGTVSANDLAGNAVTSAKIQDGTIVAADIASNTITGSKLVNGTVTATQIAAGTITATQIANTTITGAKIANATITVANMANSSVGSNQLVNGSVHTGKLDIVNIDARYINTGGDAMTGNLNLNGNWLSGDGSNSGIFLAGNGNVGLGTNGPTAALHVTGSAKFQQGIIYVAPAENLSMGIFTNSAGL